MHWHSALDDLVDVLSTRVDGSAFGRKRLGRVMELAERQRVLATVGHVLASNQGRQVSPQFAEFLVQRGSALEPADRALVAAARNTTRNRDLYQQFRSIRSALELAGVDVLPLKGAAILGEDPEFVRELTDLDLLVLDPERMEDARRILLERGYRDATSAEYEHQTLLADVHQLTPLLRDGHAGSIELHRTVLQTEYHSLFDTDFTTAHSISTGAGPALTRFAFALHAVIHAGVVDHGIARLDAGLRPALDLVHTFRRDPSVALQLLRHAERSPGAVAHAIRVYILVAGRLAGDLDLPKPGARAEWWWFRTRIVSQAPRLHAVLQRAALAPFALSRERMEARHEGPLGWPALQVSRLRFLISRTRRWKRTGV